MTIAGIAPDALTELEHRVQLRRAVIASTIGTTIEWYDFFLYSTVTGLVFAKLYFPQSDPLVGTLQAFAIYAVGFVARPVGAAIFGHYGDRIGRKAALIATLLLMGIATFLVAFVPTYAEIGIWGAILLTILRFVQGVGVSGEQTGWALEISGLPAGATISSGRSLGAGGWRIPASEVANAMIRPPQGVRGILDLRFELRLADDTVVDRGSLRRRLGPVVKSTSNDSMAASALSAQTTTPTDRVAAIKGDGDARPENSLLPNANEPKLAVSPARSEAQPSVPPRSTSAAAGTSKQATSGISDVINLSAVMPSRAVCTSSCMARQRSVSTSSKSGSSSASTILFCAVISLWGPR